MTPEQLHIETERENARDKKKFIVLAVFTVLWLLMTVLNNVYLSKKAEGAVSWGNTLIANNNQLLVNQQIVMMNESNIINNQQRIEKRLIEIQNELDSKKSQPYLSPRAKTTQINTVRSSNLTPYQSK